MALSRHEKMVNAATWLAEQGCYIGWGEVAHGKAVKREWKSDMTNDPALVPTIVHGKRNALAIAAGRVIIIDIDQYGGYEALLAAGLPADTFRVFSPTVRSGPDGITYRGVHVYGLRPEGYPVDDIPSTMQWGELRRSESGEQSMVLGPWAMRPDGIYEPDPSSPHTLAVFPKELLDFIRAHPRLKPGQVRIDGEVVINIPLGDDDEWLWEDEGGRHDYLRDRIRFWRGKSLTGDPLRTYVWEYIEKHQLNQPGWRPITKDEVERMCAGAEVKYRDDEPGETYRASPTAPTTSIDTDLIDGSFPDTSIVWDVAHFQAQAIVEDLAVATTADPIGMMGVLFAAWGGVFGTTAQVYEEQPSNIFTVLVGETGRSRKGTATRLVLKTIADAVDTPGSLAPAFASYQHEAGSGEGLMRLLSEGNPFHGLFTAEEFEQTLIRMRSTGNNTSTLDLVLRKAFDGSAMSRAIASGSFVVQPGYSLGLVGNITPTGLRANIPPGFTSNGFGNRVLFLPVRDSNVAITGVPRLIAYTEEKVRKARDYWVKGGRQFILTPKARAAVDAYATHLSQDRGMYAAMSSRLHVLAARIGLIHASLEHHAVVEESFIKSGIALCEYSRMGWPWAFGSGLDDPFAVDVLGAVVASGAMTQTDVRRHLQHHAGRFVAVQNALVGGGLVKVTSVASGGRPRQVWTANVSTLPVFR